MKSSTLMIGVALAVVVLAMRKRGTAATINPLAGVSAKLGDYVNADNWNPTALNPQNWAQDWNASFAALNAPQTNAAGQVVTTFGSLAAWGVV